MLLSYKFYSSNATYTIVNIQLLWARLTHVRLFCIAFTLWEKNLTWRGMPCGEAWKFACWRQSQLLLLYDSKTSNIRKLKILQQLQTFQMAKLHCISNRITNTILWSMQSFENSHTSKNGTQNLSLLHCQYHWLSSVLWTNLALCQNRKPLQSENMATWVGNLAVHFDVSAFPLFVLTLVCELALSRSMVHVACSIVCSLRMACRIYAINLPRLQL